MSSNFLKLIGASVFAIATGIFFINMGVQNKDAFNKVSGKIVMFENNYSNVDERHSGKMKFIRIDTYNDIFEVFVGKDFSDFKPDFEKIGELKVGDVIDVYFTNNPIETHQEPVNRHTQFIYKDNSPFFIKGTADKPLAITMICLGLAMIVLALFLKKIEKI